MNWTVSKKDAGVKLVVFVKQNWGEIHSLKEVKKAIESQCCRVNGRVERFASKTLLEGDEVFFQAGLFQKKTHLKFELSRVLYEDSNFLIYNKPVNIACDAAGMEALIRTKIPTALLTHRLDRETTGALILAKGEISQKAIIEIFRKKQVHKEYLAWVEGRPNENEGVVQNQLGKLKSWQGQSIWGEVKQGLFAETGWKCEKRRKKISLIRCFPKTGRTHQIRVHLSSIGLPIVGDRLYNSKCEISSARCLLHAILISFDDPFSGKFIQIEAPLEEDFKSYYENPHY